MILNFGHTFAHAIENGMGYGEWLHGEAVGCGMVQAAELSALVCNFASAKVAQPKVEDALEVHKEPGATVADSSEAAAEVARQAQIARDAGAGTGRTGGIYGIDGVRPAGEE